MTAGGLLFAHYQRTGERAHCPARPEPPSVLFRGTSLVISRPVQLDRDTVGTLRLLADLRALRRRVELYALTVMGALLTAALAALLVSSACSGWFPCPSWPWGDGEDHLR